MGGEWIAHDARGQLVHEGDAGGEGHAGLQQAAKRVEAERREGLWVQGVPEENK